MANRFFSPNQQFSDATGLPYAGGSLTFYASGTSTPLATYSNRALSIANTNPVVLDSAGRSGDVFLQNLAYKVVLADVNSNVIWTEDPVYSSDFSTVAGFQSGAGSPNGNTAGSQGSPTVPASVYWDTTNNILYVCTTTGTTTTSVWTAVNSSTAAAVVPPPQGYLTLTTGTPIQGAADVTVAAGGNIYYTPYVGNIVSIYNGSSFVPTVFSELSLTLNVAHAASNIYDIYAFNNSGVVTLATGPSWVAGTAGSISVGLCARGTGAGGAALTRINGQLVNAVQITGRNGSTTYTINANLATYLGSILMDTTNGSISCQRTFGQSRKWGLWNAFNRAPVNLIMGTPSASWSNAPVGWRQSVADPANNIIVFTGLAEEEFELSFTQQVQNIVSAGTTSSANIGIGVNSVTVPSGIAGVSFATLVGGTTTTIGTSAKASHVLGPALGTNQVNAIEQAPNGGTNNTFLGTALNMAFTARYRG